MIVLRFLGFCILFKVKYKELWIVFILILYLGCLNNVNICCGVFNRLVWESFFEVILMIFVVWIVGCFLS